MWSNETPREDGWYLTRRYVADDVLYSVFWWSERFNKWCYLKVYDWEESVSGNAGKYVDAWIPIPE